MTSTTQLPSKSAPNVTEQTAKALATLGQAVSALRAQLDATTQRKKELLERRTALYTVPLTPADIRQCLGELIDARANRYLEALREYGWAEKLAEPRRGVGKGAAPLTLEDAESMLGNTLATPRREDPLSEWSLPIFLNGGAFEASWPYFIFGDLMKEKLSHALAEIQSGGIDGSDHGDMPSIDERRLQIVAIDAELRTLDTESGRLRGEISKLSSPVLSSAAALKKAAEAV